MAFVGHASQVATPGQFFSSRMGSDPVLVTRDAQGGINVLLNSCRHRGMAVCRYDEGRTLQFTCPYHGWSYSMDGSLVSTPGDLHGVPQHGMAYGNTLDKSKWGLVRTAKSHNYKGLIFACWDPDAPEFDQYVGDFHHWLDNLADAFDGTEGTTEVFRGVQKWRIRSNWKFVSENFLGDTYHGATTHVSVEQVGIGPGGRNSRRHGERHDQGGFSQGRVKTSFRMGHGASDNLAYEMPYPEFADEPDMNAYFVKAWEVRKSGCGTRAGGSAVVDPRRCSPTCHSLPVSADDPGVAPDQRHRNRGVALVPHRQKCTRTCARLAAALLHTLLRARRYDRTRRYGELGLRHGPAWV